MLMRKYIDRPAMVLTAWAVSAGLLGSLSCIRLDGELISGSEELAELLGVDQEETDPTPRDDLDGDGLTNEEEEQLGTNPSDADSDGDGSPDDRELRRGTDPNTPNQDTTVEGVPSAFDGLLQPGESRAFFRGPNAIASAYLRVMGLVRQETTLRIDWQEVVDGQAVFRATTRVTMQPRQYWYWGHDLGPRATISEPASMTVSQFTVTVEEGGDSLFYSFISSGGLSNGPRGLVEFPPILVDAEYDFDVLFAHGFADSSPSWDSFALMIERISPDIRILRTDTEPLGTVNQRAGELGRFVLREEPTELFTVAHSMGGLDLRFLATEAARGNSAFAPAADSLRAIYTIATPHRGAKLADLADTFEFVADLVDSKSPAVIDMQPDSTVITAMNEAFDGDISIEDRVIPLVALVFHAGEVLGPFQGSDGIVNIESQAYGQHVVTDIPSTRGAAPGAGRHISVIPTRADPELTSFEVLGWILSDIVERRQTVPSSPEDSL